MRLSHIPLAALFALISATKDCKGQNLISTKEVYYTIDPTYVIFPLEASFSDLISTIQTSTMKTTVGPDTTTVVPNIFSSGCQMTIRAHSASNITTSQLGKLFSASMDDTELFCHSASVKIHNLGENRHTMLSRHFKVRIEQGGVEGKFGDVPSVEHWVTCAVMAPEKVREERDCVFCGRVKSELEGACDLPGLGKVVDEIGASFGAARCEGCL